MLKTASSLDVPASSWFSKPEVWQTKTERRKSLKRTTCILQFECWVVTPECAIILSKGSVDML